LERTKVINDKPNAPTIVAKPNTPGTRYSTETIIPMPKRIKQSEIINPTIGEIPNTLALNICLISIVSLFAISEIEEFGVTLVGLYSSAVNGLKGIGN
jgi:hypothetical protein